MIYIEPEHRLTISFTRTTEGDDISTFLGVVNKCADEARKSGYKRMFSVEESTLIKALQENLKGEK